MKASLLLLSFAVATLSHSQPTPEWTSPIYNNVTQGGWLTLRDNPLEVRFYIADTTQLLIMNGAYSSTIAVTIAKSPEEWLELVYDVSGDGKRDVVFGRTYWEGANYRFARRIVNAMNGETIFIFDDPSYSYLLLYTLGPDKIPDIDNDGYNEILVCRRTVENAYTQQYFVYNTNGVSSSSFANPSPLNNAFSLSQNFPNPFNPDTRITYDLDTPGAVQIEIFDVAGRLVRILAFGHQMAGIHEIIWDGMDNSGALVSSGVYFYALRGEETHAYKKMILLR